MFAETKPSLRDSEYRIDNDVRLNGLDLNTLNIDESIQKSKDREISLSPNARVGDFRPAFEMGESSKHIGAYQSLEAHKCAVAPHQFAIWHLKGFKTLLCAFGATVLINEGLIHGDDLMLYHGMESINRCGPIDPLSGGTIALPGSVGGAMKDVATIPTDVVKIVRSPPKCQSMDPALQGSNSMPIDNHGDKASKAALATTKNLGRILETSLTAPMAFTLGMFQGFRNLPMLYGESNMPVEDVTGWQSGLKTAGKEFSRSMYDGLSGIVINPYYGARTEGGTGMLKGLGKGIAGVMTKPGAAIFALPAYTLQGIHRSIHLAQYRDTSGFESELRAALFKRGEMEYEEASEEERNKVLIRGERIVEGEWRTREKAKGKERRSRWGR